MSYRVSGKLRLNIAAGVDIIIRYKFVSLELFSKKATKNDEIFTADLTLTTGKSLSEALLFAEHGENMLCTKNVLNVRNNFCSQHVLPRFELGIFMY